SRSRQLVSPTTSDARNASADEKAWAAKPNCRSRSGSDSRTDSSSSTIDTSERLSVMSASSRCRVGNDLWTAGIPFARAAPAQSPAEDAPVHRQTSIRLWYRSADDFLAVHEFVIAGTASRTPSAAQGMENENAAPGPP